MSAPTGNGGYTTKYTLGSWSAVNNGVFVDADNCWWKVTTEQGWSGRPAPRKNPIPREQSDGDIDGDRWEGSRTIILAGTVWAGDQITLQRKIDQIDALLVAGPRSLPLVVSEAHATRQCVVSRDDATLAAKWAWFLATWSLTLYAADPTKYSAALNHAGTGLYSGANGRVFPQVFPMAFGSLGNQGLAAVHNAGTLDTYPLLTLTAAPAVPLVNPQVRLVGGGQLQIGMTVDPGSYLLVDLQNQAVLLNGIADRTGLASGTFFSCPPGDSQILFTADSGFGATLDAAWRDPTP